MNNLKVQPLYHSSYDTKTNEGTWHFQGFQQKYDFNGKIIPKGKGDIWIFGGGSTYTFRYKRFRWDLLVSHIRDVGWTNLTNFNDWLNTNYSGRLGVDYICNGILQGPDGRIWVTTAATDGSVTYDDVVGSVYNGSGWTSATLTTSADMAHEVWGHSLFLDGENLILVWVDYINGIVKYKSFHYTTSITDILSLPTTTLMTLPAKPGGSLGDIYWFQISKLADKYYLAWAPRYATGSFGFYFFSNTSLNGLSEVNSSNWTILIPEFTPLANYQLYYASIRKHKGKLVFFYVKEDSVVPIPLNYKYSLDDGRTWSQEQRIDEEEFVFDGKDIPNNELWTLIESFTGVPTTVSSDGDVFTLDTSNETASWYYQRNPGGDGTRSWFVETKLKVVSEGSAGPQLMIIDDGVYRWWIYFYTGHVTFTDNINHSVYTMDTTDNFHIYRLEVIANRCRLLIDGILRVDWKVGNSSAGRAIAWGDISAAANWHGKVIWKYVYYKSLPYQPLYPTCFIDENENLWLLSSNETDYNLSVSKTSFQPTILRGNTIFLGQTARNVV